MTLPDLSASPFFLNDEARAWVARTRDALSLDEKLAQLLLPISLGLDWEELDRFLSLGVGGVSRFATLDPQALRDSATYLQERSRIPLLLSTDLEGGELASVGGPAGTPYPNQMAVAATDDPVFARRFGQVLGREGRAVGFNCTFSPVTDLDLNPLNPIVNTRSFGSDVGRVTAFCEAAIRGFQAEGVAACAKHWPGDGVDYRNQHLVTSENTLDLPAWEASYGAMYRHLIASGVKIVMPGHITLPAYAHARGRPDEADLPATLSPLLTTTLLRDELGFGGVVVSDATEMGGFTSQGPREDLVPQVIAAGCDILLFPTDVERDLEFLRRGVRNGRLSEARVDEAVTRVLALKASLGLHQSTGLPDLGTLRAPEHLSWAEECAARAVTLVSDTQHLLPLDPARHRRLLIIRQPQRRNGLGFPLPDLRVPELLEQAGFEVTLYTPQTHVSPDLYDALLYVLAEEALMVTPDLRLDWVELHGTPFRAMERFWDVLPTAIVSLGTPRYAQDAPRCRTLVNAYSPVMPVQEAVVRALTGQQPFQGVSPVDASSALRPVREWRNLMVEG
ncbi:glycoside hydrolase family 3 protein [Deinococcus geothermalis]|uniref:beta-N-acetylhexosaminidase n=1 Tax=Deinococcus geothermalis (strain DSM 11300 / CIP 105573 / AG-3a) TaxID=319795 RepID=Q1J2S2_DEIGD|nr:glycoside hydrolase family 3 N-terminal domain-containing protein [Deinococcus geothermalis]ABF44212.1 glycoside hydrolase, family 3-like protein [Deinococcus geothermalis DSM 11300]